MKRIDIERLSVLIKETLLSDEELNNRKNRKGEDSRKTDIKDNERSDR